VSDELAADQYSKARADLRRRRILAWTTFASSVPGFFVTIWLFLGGSSWAIMVVPLGLPYASGLYLSLFRCRRCKGRLWAWSRRTYALRGTHCFTCDLRL